MDQAHLKIPSGLSDSENMNTDDETTPSTKQCPSCAETILAQAKKCKHCGDVIDLGLRYEASLERAKPSFNPGLAAVLSFFIPGVGQIYRGQVIGGVGWLFFVIMGYFLFVVPGIILHIACIVNAYQEPTNARRTATSGSSRALIGIFAVALALSIAFVLKETKKNFNAYKERAAERSAATAKPRK